MYDAIFSIFLERSLGVVLSSNAGSIEVVYGRYASGNVFFIKDAMDNPARCSATSESYPILSLDAQSRKLIMRCSFYWLAMLPGSKQRFVAGMMRAYLAKFL